MKKSFARGLSSTRTGSTLWGGATNSLKNSDNGVGQKALDELKELCDQKKYTEVLEKIPFIEKEFPSCTKAVIYYRGLAKYEILKDSGHLPQLTHMKN
jgi:hypothetical protein